MDPEGSLPVHEQGPDLIAGEAVRVIRRREERLERGVRPVGVGAGQPEEAAAVRADPQVPARVPSDGGDVEPCGLRIPDDGAGDRVEAVQPARERADPDTSVAIFEEGGDVAARERRGVEGVVAEDDERVPVVAVEPVLRPDPHEPLAVLEEGVDGVLREPIFDRQVAEAGFRSDRPGLLACRRRQAQPEREPSQ